MIGSINTTIRKHIKYFTDGKSRKGYSSWVIWTDEINTNEFYVNYLMHVWLNWCSHTKARPNIGNNCVKINKRNEKKATKNSSTSLQWHSIVLNFPIFVVSLGNFDAFSASSLIKVFAYGFHLSCPRGCLDDKISHNGNMLGSQRVNIILLFVQWMEAWSGEASQNKFKVLGKCLPTYFSQYCYAFVDERIRFVWFIIFHLSIGIWLVRNKRTNEWTSNRMLKQTNERK